jgi:hypothetical protein
MDFLLVAACSLTFVLVANAARDGGPRRPPIDLIARDLGTTPEQFRQVAERYLPHPPSGPPTESQKMNVAIALDVTVEQLDAVMEKYRPDRLRQR